MLSIDICSLSLSLFVEKDDGCVLSHPPTPKRKHAAQTKQTRRPLSRGAADPGPRGPPGPEKPRGALHVGCQARGPSPSNGVSLACLVSLHLVPLIVVGFLWVPLTFVGFTFYRPSSVSFSFLWFPLGFLRFPLVSFSLLWSSQGSFGSVSRIITGSKCCWLPLRTPFHIFRT